MSRRSRRGGPNRPSLRPHLGLCWRCDEPALPGRRVCERHADRLDEIGAELRRTGARRRQDPER